RPGGLSDDAPATSAGLELGVPGQSLAGIAVDNAGNVYFAESGRVRVLVPVLVPMTPMCSSSVRPSAVEAPATGGAVTFSIQTDPACPSRISGLPDWLTVSSAVASDSGFTTINLFALENPGGARSGPVFVANGIVTVTQSRGASP